MSKGVKIRNLVEHDGLATSLNDIVTKAISLNPDLIDLEYGNKKTHLTKAKKGVRELEAVVKSLKGRLNNEVSEEVLLHAKARRDNYPKEPNFLKDKK